MSYSADKTETEPWKNISDLEYAEVYRKTKQMVILMLKEVNKTKKSTSVTRTSVFASGYPSLKWEIDNCLDNYGVSHGRIFRLEENDGNGNLTISETSY